MPTCAKMAISLGEAELLLTILRSDDESNRENSLDREPAFEGLEAKLIEVIRYYRED